MTLLQFLLVQQSRTMERRQVLVEQGTVDWDTGSIKTATFTAVSGNGFFVNTTGGLELYSKLNLPAGYCAVAD